MAKYEFIDTSGKAQTIEADSSSAAIANAPNRAPTSGVRLLQSAPTPTPSTPTPDISSTVDSNTNVTSSSRSQREEETRLKNELDGLSPTPVDEKGIRSAYDTSYIDDEIKRLESSLSGQFSGINRQFDEARRNTEDAQQKEKGATTVTLARLGGYLGPSASATGAMLNLAQEHRNEINSLESKRQAAIQAAQDAFNERRFELVALKVKEAREMADTILKRKDAFFDQSLELQREIRQQDEFERDRIKERLETLSVAGVDPSADDKAEIDSFYGVEGFTDQYLEVSKAAAEAESEKAKLEVQTKLLNLLQNIPQGQTVAFPDGTQYTGMGKTSDITTSLQVDANGIGRMISYNKGSGAVSVTNVGAVGKPSGSGSGSSVPTEEKDAVVSTFQIALEDSKLEDGTYDPDTYVEYREYLKDEYPALIDDMDKLFLNPSYNFFNDDAILRLRKKGIFAGDAPITD